MQKFDYTQFRTNLKSLFDTHGKYIREVCLELGITPSTLSRYLNGHRDPDLEYVIVLAQYFGVSIDWLVGLGGSRFDSVPESIRSFVDKYQKANADDRKIVDMILEKYN